MPNPIRHEEELYDLWVRLGITGLSFGALRGERVTVVAPGRRNDGAGPDFLDAVLLIDGVMRSGAVEMHLREGDWMAHRHDADPAYRSVILHLLAVSPPELLLPLVTVDAITLSSAVAAGEARPIELVPSGDPAELMVELAWSRLLRRATAIIRGEPELPPVDRVRRAFLRRLFDALGYATNRDPMGELIELLLPDERRLASEGLDRLTARVLGASGLPREALASVGRGFADPARLDAILSGSAPARVVSSWRHDTRPANSPARRVWEGAVLLFGVLSGDLLAGLLDAVRGRSFARAVALLDGRSGGGGLVGEGRAREIVINALLPASLALGVLDGDPALIEGTCIIYRGAPSLAGNRIVRSVEQRYGKGVRLRGAFMQQGAIEFHQRYRTNDNENLSFIAEETPARGNGEGAAGSFSPHT